MIVKWTWWRARTRDESALAQRAYGTIDHCGRQDPQHDSRTPRDALNGYRGWLSTTGENVKLSSEAVLAVQVKSGRLFSKHATDAFVESHGLSLVILCCLPLRRTSREILITSRSPEGHSITNEVSCRISCVTLFILGRRAWTDNLQ